MTDLTDREARSNVDPYDWPDIPAKHDHFRDDPGPDLDAANWQEDGGWRNPPYEVRVFFVGVVWAIPGALAGLMANLLLHFTADPVVAAATGSVLFAFTGGRVEAVG